MNKTKIILSIFLTSLLLSACGTIGEGLGGSKKKLGEEFLVKKKAPLVLPPSFGELPEPETSKKKNVASDKENQLNIEELLGQGSSKDIDVKKNELNKSIEKSIIEKINEK